MFMPFSQGPDGQPVAQDISRFMIKIKQFV